MPIESPLARPTYEAGALVQACGHCDWAQRGHRAELARYPECDAPLPAHIAIQFGGISVTYNGTNFDVSSRSGGFVSLQAADYADLVAFMCRHGFDDRGAGREPRVRRVAQGRDFDDTVERAWSG